MAAGTEEQRRVWRLGPPGQGGPGAAREYLHPSSLGDGKHEECGSIFVLWRQPHHAWTWMAGFAIEFGLVLHWVNEASW